MWDLMEMHFQGVAVAALQEVLHTHLRIAARSHHLQVEGTDMMVLPTSLLYHHGRRVKLFTNIEMMIRYENRSVSTAQHMKSVNLLNQDVHSVV